MSELATEQMESAGVKIPPPTIYATAVALGFGIDYLWPLKIYSALQPKLIGFGLVIFSFLLAVSAFREFVRAQTNIRPDRPTSKIITSGPYRFTRNPLYLALALLQAGIGFVAANTWILILLIPVVIIITYCVIRREEAYLTRKFGKTYANYRSTVRRWI